MKNSPIILAAKSPLIPLAWITILASTIFFFCLGNFFLFNPDEGLYAEPAREMLETGEYITTTLNYAVRFTKPPLVIWAMAIAYKIFGINEFAARVFPASTGLLMIIAAYLFTNKYLGKRIAIFTAFILLTSPLFVGVGRMAITDMPLSLFITGSLFSFYHAWKQKNKYWLHIGYTFTALAIMTKGPVGLLLPIVILISFFYLSSADKETVRFFSLSTGTLIIALIALPWFLIEIAITKGAYFNEFIMRENFARFTTVVDSHKGPWFYHIAAIFAGMFPWSLLLPQSIVRITKDMYAEINLEKVQNKKNKIMFLLTKWKNSCKNLSQTNEILLFALIAAVIIVTFFSASVSKLLPYTLPAFPFLAILIGYQWNLFIEKAQGKSILVYSIVMSFIYLVIAFLCPIAFKFLRNAPPQLTSLTFQYACLMTAITLFCTLIAIKKRLLSSIILLFSATTISMAIFLPRFLSAVCQFWEGDTPQYAKLVSQSRTALIVYKLRKPGIPFYLGRKAIQCNSEDDLIKTTKTFGSCYLITSRKYLPEAQANGYKILTSKENFALLDIIH